MSTFGGAIGRVYAAALYELARDGGALEERLEEVRALAGVIDREKGLREILTSPRISVAEKERLVSDVMGPGVSTELKNLVNLLIGRNRHFFLREILETFVEIYREEKGQIKAKVTTALPLDDETAGRLAAALGSRTGREVLFDRSVDAGLVGGVVIRYGDYIVDGSLKTRIRKMKESLLETTDQQGS